MHPVNSAEYQAAVEEAANAFMKVMALRGFAVRDYPQNFVAHVAQQTRLHFETSRAGAHPEADALVSEFIRSGQSVPRSRISHPYRLAAPDRSIFIAKAGRSRRHA